MTLDLVLFILRLLSGSLLIALLGAILFVLWRDFRAVAQATGVTRRVYGKLLRLIDVDEQYAPTGDTYPLRPLTTFGRSPTNSIVLADDFASSEHATITLRDGRWWLEDRNSRNGTLLNGEPISTAIIVTDGDIISIGSTHFKLTLDH